MISHEELLLTKRDDILRIAARYGAYNVRIFGSVARGEADSESDIDLLVNMEPGRSLLDLCGFLIDLEEMLGCKVDVVTEKGLREEGAKRSSSLMRDVSERLRDIQEAIKQITKYTDSGRQSFDQNELVRIWVIHHLESIGDAARSIPQEFKNSHPEVPWQQISRMR
jgi:predicted nucleotidyltransferase